MVCSSISSGSTVPSVPMSVEAEEEEVSVVMGCLAVSQLLHLVAPQSAQV